MTERTIPLRPLNSKSQICISQVGMGTASLGNVYGEISQEEKIDNIHTAFRGGINYFDTSPFYGGTTSEYYLGLGLRDLPRSEVVVATKVGRFSPPPSANVGNAGSGGWFDFSKSAIEKSLKESMSRLGVNHIDMYQLHDVEHCTPNGILDEALIALDSLRTQGFIGAIGLNGYPLEMFPILLNGAQDRNIFVDTIFTYGQNSLQCSRIRQLHSTISKFDVGILSGSPLQLGFLSDGEIQDWLPVTTEMKEAKRTCQELCFQAGTTLSQIALKYSFYQEQDLIVSTITGGRTSAETQSAIDVFKKSAIPSTEDQQLFEKIRDIFRIIPSGRGKLDEQWPAHSGHQTFYTYENSTSWKTL